MKKSIAVLVMMLGMGSSIAFAQKSFGQESFDSFCQAPFISPDEFIPVEEQELPEVVINTLNNNGALVKEVYMAFTVNRGRIFRVIILSCRQVEETVYLDERGNFVKP